MLYILQEVPGPGNAEGHDVGEIM